MRTIACNCRQRLKSVPHSRSPSTLCATRTMTRFTSVDSALELHYRFSSIAECVQVESPGLCKPVDHYVLQMTGCNKNTSA